MEKQKKVSKKRRKYSIYSLIIVVIILLAIIYGIFTLGRCLYYSLKYGEYEKKMDQYGLSELYNNKKATSKDKVTNSEMVKVIIGSVMNIDDASGLVYIEENIKYDNQYFVEYAKKINVIDEKYITDKNESEKASYGQSTEIAYNVVKKILQKEDKDIKSVGTSNLIKGELNKIVVQIVEKYSTIYSGSMKNAKIVTDKDKLPSNYEVYPYIIDTIPKEVYEIELRCLSEERYQTPKNEYKKRREVYSQIDSYIKTYYDVILNVDYNIIDETKFFNSIKDILYYEYTDDSMHDYVEYVKKHKIKLQGEATPLLPIIYNDGEHNIVRTKIKFKVISSDTDINLLMPDIFNNDNIKYDGKEFEFYIDLNMGTLLVPTTLRMTINSLPDYILNDGAKISRIE